MYKIHARNVRRSSRSPRVCAVTRPGTYVKNAATSTKTVKFSYPKSALGASKLDWILKWHRRCSLYDDVRNHLEYIYIYIVQWELVDIGFGDGHFYHAMRWRCFIFYNDAISIIFWHSLQSPSLRLFFQTIGIDYFLMFV